LQKSSKSESEKFSKKLQIKSYKSQRCKIIHHKNCLKINDIEIYTGLIWVFWKWCYTFV